MLDLAVRELISRTSGVGDERETERAREVLWALRAHKGLLPRAPAYLEALLDRLGEEQAR